MKNSKAFTSLAVCSLLWLLASCTKCKDCTLTTTVEIEGAEDQVSQQMDEYCGNNLESIENNPEYNRDNVEYSWSCE